MSDPRNDLQRDAGANASGSQSDSAETYDIVDSGQSEDIENSLTAQGYSDRAEGEAPTGDGPVVEGSAVTEPPGE